MGLIKEYIDLTKEKNKRNLVKEYVESINPEKLNSFNYRQPAEITVNEETETRNIQIMSINTSIDVLNIRSFGDRNASHYHRGRREYKVKILYEGYIDKFLCGSEIHVRSMSYMFKGIVSDFYTVREDLTEIIYEINIITDEITHYTD